MSTIAVENGSITKPQRSDGTCVSYRNLIAKRAVIVIIALIVTIVSGVVSYKAFQPTFQAPEFEQSVEKGTPKLDQKYAYTKLDFLPGFSFVVCGMPKNDGKSIDFYATNPEGNAVWFRLEVIDSKGNVIGKTGILKQGQYIKTINLTNMLAEGKNDLALRVISYSSDGKWESNGSVKLNIPVTRDYK